MCVFIKSQREFLEVQPSNETQYCSFGSIVLLHNVALRFYLAVYVHQLKNIIGRET